MIICQHTPAGPPDPASLILPLNGHFPINLPIQCQFKWYTMSFIFILHYLLMPSLCFPSPLSTDWRGIEIIHALMVWWGMIPGWSKALKADTDSYWNPNDLPLFLRISSFNLTQDPLFPPDWQSPKPPPSSLSLVPCRKPVNGCFSWPISLEWSRMWTFTTFLKIHFVCVHNILLARERERELDIQMGQQYNAGASKHFINFV